MVYYLKSQHEQTPIHNYASLVHFRNQILKVNVCQNGTNFELEGNKDLQILVNDKLITITPNNLVTV